VIEGLVAAAFAAFYLLSVIVLLRVRPAALFALLWLLIPMTWRVADAIYIDTRGPIYSDQLGVHIGPGTSTFLLVMNLLPVYCVFALLLPRAASTVSSDHAGSLINMRLVRRILLVSTSALAIGVLLEMLYSGVVPVLAGIERYEYAALYAGPMYRFLFRFGDPLMMFLGAVAVAPVLRGEKLDMRAVGLLLAVLALAFLTGHRFSAFFKFCTLFLVGFAAVESVSHSGIGSKRVINKALLVLSTTAILIVIPAIVLSYFSTRFDDPAEALHSVHQRMLVQQAEMWWTTHQRVVEQGNWSSSLAVDRLFVSPLDASRNTSIQYLMELSLGDDAHRVLGQGTQYAGGFPEILQEVVGPFGGPLAAAVLALAPAILLRVFVLSIIRGQPLTMLSSAWLLYPFQIMFWGGMLNFVLTWTFWAKILLFAAAWSFESKRWDGDSRPA